MNETLQLTSALIEKPSVTPHDGGCQELIAKRLARLGFKIERLDFDGVSNLWATLGNTAPVFCFAGHTDVVPPGNLKDWLTPPFEPTVREGLLYGRGAVDMKSGIASMVIATERFLAKHAFPGTLAFLITSDEEGPSIHGTKRVLETLQARGQVIDMCLVGEPSSNKVLGDTIKHGRRGSLHGTLTVFGKQGHVAYPETVINPMHIALPALTALSKHTWDVGNTDFPPTSFQITQLIGGVAKNVVPREMTASFNLRFSNESSFESIQAKTEEILNQFDFEYTLSWDLSGLPFLTQPGKLLEAVISSIQQITHQRPMLSTSGGTSDGRFFAPYGTQVVEFGHCNKTIHQINECIAVDILEQLTQIYCALLTTLATKEADQ